MRAATEGPPVSPHLAAATGNRARDYRQRGGARNADSVREVCKARPSCTAPISAILVCSHPQLGACGWRCGPAAHSAITSPNRPTSRNSIQATHLSALGASSGDIEYR
jgi:hypothetical protein